MCVQRATSCSAVFSVTSHTVVVRGEDGEEVTRVMVSSTTDPLRAVLSSLPRDSALFVEVEACNILLCRSSRAINLCEYKLD